MKALIRKSQRGFTLLELLVVMAVLSIMMAGIFSSVNSGMKRYHAEESRINTVQDGRNFLEQMVRDLHSAGYPNSRLYMQGAVIPAGGLAAGITAVSSTAMQFEGDVDNTGVVQQITYTLAPNAGATCPCTISRTMVQKGSGAVPAPTAELQDVINSVGGAGAYPIAGTTVFGGGQAPVANDVIYAGYKATSVFTYYDSNGAVINVPPDLNGGNLVLGQNIAAGGTPRVLSISLNMLSPNIDMQTKMRPAASMGASVRLNNVACPACTPPI